MKSPGPSPAVPLTLASLVEIGALLPQKVGSTPLTTPVNWPEGETAGRRDVSVTKVKNEVLSQYEQRRPYELQWMLWKAAVQLGYSSYQHPVTHEIISVAHTDKEKPAGSDVPVCRVKGREFYPFQSRRYGNLGGATSGQEPQTDAKSSSWSSSCSSSSFSSDGVAGSPIPFRAEEAHTREALHSLDPTGSSSTFALPQVTLSFPSAGQKMSDIQRGFTLTTPFSIAEMTPERAQAILDLPSYAQSHQMNLEANSHRRTCYKDPTTGCLVLTSNYLSQFPNCGGEFCKHCPHGGCCRQGDRIDSGSDSDEEEPAGSGEDDWWSGSSDSSLSIASLFDEFGAEE